MEHHHRLTLEEAHDRGFQLVRAHTERFVHYLDDLSEAEASAPVPGLRWTVGETVTHVRSVYARYTADPRRAATPEGVAVQNSDDIAESGVDVKAASVFISDQLAHLEAVVPHVAPERLFPFHAGQSTTMAGGWGNLLGELHAHGDDIARATGRPFAVPSEDLEILWRFTAPVLQGWIRPEARDLVESWRLRFPFGTVDAVLDQGALDWDSTAVDDPQHVVEVTDVADFTLVFPYRRRAVADPTTALLLSRFSDL